jgi:hypothetical protein
MLAIVHDLRGYFHLRLFLFQTLLASGPPTEPVPLAKLDLALNPPSADFATNRGLSDKLAGDDRPARETREHVSYFVCHFSDQLHQPFSPGRTLDSGTLALARKFFVTDTDLKLVGFLTEFVRACPRPSSFPDTPSGLLVSVSDPPLASASASLLKGDLERSRDGPFVPTSSGCKLSSFA